MVMLQCPTNGRVERLKDNLLPIESDENSMTLLEATRMNNNIGLTHTMLMVRPSFKFEQDENGRSPLSWAASDGWVEIIRSVVWLKAKSEINQRDTSGHTSLFYAALAELSGETVLILVESGANPKSQARFLRPPSSYAAEKGKHWGRGAASKKKKKDRLALQSVDQDGNTALERILSLTVS